MAFAQSFYNQSSVLRINVMVVDDDPVFLQIMSRMLANFNYRDPSTMEITVIAVKDSREALSTLKIQRNNIDLIVTDYYMPDMNGLQLKKQITREFGNLPVIVMSSDTDKEHESLTCGAMGFIPKPIKSTDLTKICNLALTSKRNGKSNLWIDNNHNDTDVSIPQQIQLVPEQDNLIMTTKKKFSPRPHSRPVNSSNGSCVSTDASRKNKKPNGGSGDDVESLSQPSKKSKITWTDDLHDLFLQAIRHIGLDKAVPKKILEFMNVSYLTRENVASHLQKYRQFLRKVAERGSLCSNMLPGSGIDSIYPYPHIREPYYNNYTSSSWYGTSLNNRSLYSKPGSGLGQSRLLSNTTEPVRFNPMPHNYMNPSSTYEPHRIGSNLTLPFKSNFNFSSHTSQNEGRRSFVEPTLVANKTSQTPQVLGSGQHGLSDINGSSFNNTLSSYGTLTPNQLGINSYGSLTSTQPRMTSLGSPTLGVSAYGSSTSTQQGMSSHGRLPPNQPGISSYGSLTSTQPGMSSHENLSPNQPGMSSYKNLTYNQPEINSHGSLSPHQPQMSSYGNLTSNQLGLSSHGILTPNQQGLKSYGSATHDAQLHNFGSLTPHQPGSSNFSYGLQSLSNNENTAYKPQLQPHANATAHPNTEVPQLENLSNINEFLCDISNFELDHNKQQEEVSTTQFELPANFLTEINQLFSLEEGDDWNFVNTYQGRSNGETSNNFAHVTNSQTFNMSANRDQEQDAPDFVDWSFLNPEDLANEYDFVDSLFNGLN